LAISPNLIPNLDAGISARTGNARARPRPGTDPPPILHEYRVREKGGRHCAGETMVSARSLRQTGLRCLHFDRSHGRIDAIGPLI